MVQTDEEWKKITSTFLSCVKPRAQKASVYPEEIYAGGARIFNRDGGGRTQKAIINLN